MRLYLLCQQKNNRGLYFLVIFLSIVEIFLLGDANALLDCFALLAMTGRDYEKTLRREKCGEFLLLFYFYFGRDCGKIYPKT